MDIRTPGDDLTATRGKKLDKVIGRVHMQGWGRWINDQWGTPEYMGTVLAANRNNALVSTRGRETAGIIIAPIRI